MSNENLQKLTIEKEGKSISLSLDETQLKFVKGYQLDSVESGTAILTVRLLVSYP